LPYLARVPVELTAGGEFLAPAGLECRVAYRGPALAVCGLCPIRPACLVRLPRLVR
jgi:hypothetical protein